MGFIEELRRIKADEAMRKVKSQEDLARREAERQAPKIAEAKRKAELRRRSEDYLSQTSFKALVDQLHEIDDGIHIGELMGTDYRQEASIPETNASMCIIFESIGVNRKYREKCTIVEANPDGDVFVYKGDLSVSIGRGLFVLIGRMKLPIHDWKDNPQRQEEALGIAYRNPLKHRGISHSSAYPIRGGWDD